MYKYTIRQTTSFEVELENIYRYLAFSLKEPNTAKKYLNTIIEKIYSLQFFPERYSKIHNFKNRNIRKMPVNNYLVIFEVVNDTRSSFYSTYFSRFTKLFQLFII